ncbi:hypothetical protein B484DRAFT_233372 [Ochromonadaceae sp. CCMP2298]|nr:hypothetical protein B484DRAFT_233372 [Ochromonadaceae sp. CCMP2298]
MDPYAVSLAAIEDIKAVLGNQIGNQMLLVTLATRVDWHNVYKPTLGKFITWITETLHNIRETLDHCLVLHEPNRNAGGGGEILEWKLSREVGAPMTPTHPVDRDRYSPPPPPRRQELRQSPNRDVSIPTYALRGNDELYAELSDAQIDNNVRATKQYFWKNIFREFQDTGLFSRGLLPDQIERVYNNAFNKAVRLTINLGYVHDHPSVTFMTVSSSLRRIMGRVNLHAILFLNMEPPRGNMWITTTATLWGQGQRGWAAVSALNAVVDVLNNGELKLGNKTLRVSRAYAPPQRGAVLRCIEEALELSDDKVRLPYVPIDEPLGPGPEPNPNPLQLPPVVPDLPPLPHTSNMKPQAFTPRMTGRSWWQ